MVNRSRGDFAYTMIDLDGEVNGEVLPGLEDKISQIANVVTINIF